MAIDQRVLDTIALSRDEYELIVSRLGREPSEVELGMFGALWSEHCGYKNSRPLLRQLPAEGPFVLTKRGEENAGAVDIGDGMCVVMKIESHNHPSAIEKLVSAKAEGEGNLLMLAGADTGRDGIHGASGLASRTDPQARFDELRPAVQVGNPFLE